MSKRTCSTTGCKRPHHARGYCDPCYRAALAAGTIAPKQSRGLSDEQRFWSKVKKTDACWLWQGADSSHGYGLFVTGPKGGQTKRRPFKVAYELLVGEVPGGLVLDHLCRTRLCVNPAHLEPVTPTENILRGEAPSARNARKTHCSRGHEFTPENTYIYSSGWRECRTCRATVWAHPKAA